MAYTLGTFEQAVLATVLRLSDTAYGRTIHGELEKRLSRAVSMGSMYNTLERLEREGFLRSRLEQSNGAAGVRTRRYYDVQGDGVRALNAAYSLSKSLWAGIRWPIEEH